MVLWLKQNCSNRTSFSKKKWRCQSTRRSLWWGPLFARSCEVRQILGVRVVTLLIANIFRVEEMWCVPISKVSFIWRRGCVSTLSAGYFHSEPSSNLHPNKSCWGTINVFTVNTRLVGESFSRWVMSKSICLPQLFQNCLGACGLGVQTKDHFGGTVECHEIQKRLLQSQKLCRTAPLSTSGATASSISTTFLSLHTQVQNQ